MMGEVHLMELSSLRIFVAVADEASISKAAERLDYVQSNVTARIKQLEEELETQLFYRQRRGMALTPAGKTLRSYAERLLKLVGEARQAVRETEAIRGVLALGAMETTAAVRLPPILARYHQAYPEVDLTLSTGTSEELLSRVLDYQFDSAFVGGPVEHPEIEQEVVFTEELVLVTEQRVASLAELRTRTAFVFRQGCSYRARLEHVLRERGIIPFRLMEFGTLDGILGCVAAGMGVTLLPRSVITRLGYSDRVSVHEVAPTEAWVPTVIIRRRDALRTRALEALLDLVRASEDATHTADALAA
jgi:LysR family transcriptional regulator, cell division regulator